MQYTINIRYQYQYHQVLPPVKNPLPALSILTDSRFINIIPAEYIINTISQYLKQDSHTKPNVIHISSGFTPCEESSDSSQH